MPDETEVALVLLAAGRASRFGGGKLKASLGGKPLWKWATDAVNLAGFSRKVIVLRSGEVDIRPDADWIVVINARADEGLASSIRAGMSAIGPCTRVVVALSDMPFVSARHLKALKRKEGVVFTRHDDDRPGCPAGFPAAAFPELLNLEGDRGAAAIVSREASLLAPPDQVETRDIDTQDDLAQNQ